jgi:phosphoserine aminotransferase
VHTRKTFNFSAGPGVMAESVVRQLQNDLWDIHGSGIGVCEHSHRGGCIDKVFEDTQALFRELAGIPDNYSILFMTGGASAQFYLVPMNFLPEGRSADYIDTGVWANKAYKEAKALGKVHLAGSSADRNHSYIPGKDALRFNADAAYMHYCSNNTIYGTQWHRMPESPAGVPVICDMSSDILSRPLDVTKHHLIYAGAQKNLGPAGVTVVIARNDFIETGSTALPALMQYREFQKNDSRPNTPPVFPIYAVGEVLKWIKSEGGLKAMQQLNERKAKPLYDFLDAQDFFIPHAEKGSRSLMNVTFRLPTEELDKKFVKEATAAGFDGLKGHRNTGGMRASIYNAFPPEGVTALVAFMEKFAKANAGKAMV